MILLLEKPICVIINTLQYQSNTKIFDPTHKDLGNEILPI